MIYLTKIQGYLNISLNKLFILLLILLYAFNLHRVAVNIVYNNPKLSKLRIQNP